MRIPAPAVVLALLVAALGPVRAQGFLPGPSADSVAAAAPAALSTLPLTPDTAAVVAAMPVTGAPLTGLRAGVHARETARPNQPAMLAAATAPAQARAMMIVGVAALIAGAIIGDTPGTIIMVGGTVVGLIGLYEYLQ
ncbi:MAG: hypothetical protein ACREPM_20890 [Gemmatimonadaceae bacterium]